MSRQCCAPSLLTTSRSRRSRMSTLLLLEGRKQPPRSLLALCWRVTGQSTVTTSYTFRTQYFSPSSEGRPRSLLPLLSLRPPPHFAFLFTLLLLRRHSYHSLALLFVSPPDNQLPASAAGTSTSTCPLISPSASLAPLPRPSAPSSPFVAPKTEPLASRSAAPSPSHTAGVEEALGGLSFEAQQEGAEPSAGGSEGSEADEGEEEKLEPVFDRMDGCWRCAVCLWEISSGTCDGCEREYKINEEMETLDARIAYANTSLAFPPLSKKRNDHPDTQQDDSSSDEESHSDDGEPSLQARGAPPAMIKRYKLFYYSSVGIVATADLALRNHFDIHPSQTVSLPAADDSGAVNVIIAAPWRIHLGSRIHLLPEDTDGSLFLFDLLEEIKDVVNNAADRGYECPWVTVVETTEDKISIVWDAAASEWKEEKAIRVEWVTRRRREEGEEDCEEVDGALESDEDPDDNSYIDDEELAEPEHESEEDEGEEKEGSDGESSNPSCPCSWTDSGSEFGQEATFHDDGGDISDDPTYESLFPNHNNFPKKAAA